MSARFAEEYEHEGSLETLQYYPYAPSDPFLFSNFPFCLQGYYSIKL